MVCRVLWCLSVEVFPIHTKDLTKDLKFFPLINKHVLCVLLQAMCSFLLWFLKKCYTSWVGLVINIGKKVAAEIWLGIVWWMWKSWWMSWASCDGKTVVSWKFGKNVSMEILGKFQSGRYLVHFIRPCLAAGHMAVKFSPMFLKICKVLGDCF